MKILQKQRQKCKLKLRGKLDCLLQENEDLGILQTFFSPHFSEDVFDGVNSRCMAPDVWQKDPEYLTCSGNS